MAEIRDELFYKQKNGYDTMSTQQRIDMEDYCRGYMAFLNEARTEREAVKIAIEMAEDKGFVEYVDGVKLSPGDKVYCNNRSKALMLAVIGKKSLEEGCVSPARMSIRRASTSSRIRFTKATSLPISRLITTAA